jgi:hypothetical protein
MNTVEAHSGPKGGNFDFAIYIDWPLYGEMQLFPPSIEMGPLCTSRLYSSYTFLYKDVLF